MQHVTCVNWLWAHGRAGALPLYGSLVVLGRESGEQEAEVGVAPDGEEPPQLATVLEQVPCEAANALVLVPIGMHLRRCMHQRHCSISSTHGDCDQCQQMLSAPLGSREV
jgi:hypothetical protein